MISTPEALRRLSGEQLRAEGRKADSALGAEIDRIQLADERFRNILHWSLNVDAEQIRRKKQ